jgi:DNA polymerase-3 subunit alpha
MKFVSLHNHDGHSVYDGLGSVDDYISWGLENDIDAFAITNHGNMNSIGYMASAQKRCKEKGIPIKIIYGCEFYYVEDLERWHQIKQLKDLEKKENKKKEKENTEDKTELVIEDEGESKEKDLDPINKRHHIVLTAYNQIGLINLYRLVTRSYREGFYRKPRIDFKMLKDCSEGLVMSTACLAGVPAHLSKLNKWEMNSSLWAKYDEELLPLLEIFGKERAYLELQFNRIPEQKLLDIHLINYSQKTGYKLISTCDTHYVRPELFKDREIYKLLGYQMQKKEGLDLSILDKNIKDMSAELWLKNGNQIFEAYKECFIEGKYDNIVKESIERTYDIAHNLFEEVVPNDSIKLPKTVFIENKTSFQQLAILVRDELKKRKLPKNYVERALYELKIIKEKETAEYFLAMKEILDVLRDYMLLGPGRGSGAGSLVNYLLGITLIDPIEKNLLFERFISPYRKEVPDVDSDVEMKEESLDILKKHFGENNVIAICNYNTLKLKSLLKDISRLYSIPFEETNAVTIVVEDEAKDQIMEEVNHDQKLYELTFDRAKKYSETLQNYLNKYPQIEERIRNVYKEVKSIGRHAGGILILPNEDSCLPTIRIRGIDQSPITEGITAQHLQLFGLIKFDVLGLATLKIIRKCIEYILKKQKISNPTMPQVWNFYYQNLAPGTIDEEDKKIFKKVYRGGNFPSIFQFAERNVQSFCVKAKPKSLNDISNITSLWRPGPLAGSADKKYLERDETQNFIEEEHSILEKILGPTRGLLIYQEQFMLLAHELADFTLGEADKLRKLLVKPSQELGEEMKKERIEAGNKFIKGCIKNGLSRNRAEKLWHEEIIGFVSYGFNKAHAISYAFNSYQCAWLYTYHEEDWIKACLNADPDPIGIVQVVASLGYEIKKPDIMKSLASEWQVKERECIPPLTAVKGVGTVASNELVRIRRSQNFHSIEEFLYSVDQKGKKSFRWSKFNKKCFEPLIKIGAFDSLENNIFDNNAHMFNTFSEKFNDIKKGKKSLEELCKDIDNVVWNRYEQIGIQKELLGVYDKNLLFTPKVNKILREYDVVPLSDLCEDKQLHWFIIKSVGEGKTKKGKKYYKLRISDIDDKTMVLNYFKEDADIKINSIYIGTLFKNGNWINMEFGSKLMRIKD